MATKRKITCFHSATLSIYVWEDFLGCLGCHDDQTSGEFKIGERRMKQISEQLSYSTVAETIEWLGSYFLRSRLASNAYFGLYPKWKPLVPHLSAFFRFLVVDLIRAKLQRFGTSNFDPESAVQEIWGKILQLYSPWTQPLENKDQILSPCILNDIELAAQMTSAWLDGVNALQTAFENKLPAYSRSALSLLWPYYLQTMARRVLPQFILSMYHKCLLQLPWAKFWPDIEAVQLMLKIQGDAYPDCCTEFLGRLVTCLRWPDIVQHSVTYDVPDIVQDMHQALFTLLVRLSTQEVLLSETPLPQLISAAESFDWNLLAAGSYNDAVNWFLANCDPRCVLAERSSRSSQILCLLKIASGFVVMTPGAVHPETPVKRCMYMRCLVQLISKCSHLKDISVDSFRVIEVNLLTEMEAVVGSITDAIGQGQEALSLASELLGLLNTSNPRGGACEALLSSLLGWLSSSPSSPLLLPLLQASGRCLASLSHMACVMEASLEAYFSIPDVTEGDSCGWSLPLTVLSVPERNRKQFLQEAITQGAYLCLYAHTLQRLPLCQSMADEKQHIDSLVEWTSAAKPSGHHGQEVKLVLWWAKIFELIMRQLDFGNDTRGCVQALLKLIPALNVLGEDRASTGLMGAIGFGRKSQLSVKFRLLCRCVSTFLSAQIPSDLNLRQTSNAAGYLAEAKRRYHRPPSEAVRLRKVRFSCLRNWRR
ncbi:hypothetical protein CAPTEDRAFT_219894 [Capitella teleta]|uniref:Epg5-like central TPR repeats domain-containing protein n=1 Tax=Capitella teleta TaxID=283909 RepID=R7TZN8_CAPTE|nr:hypothetical protein CAPTEDRAFT_219894 [Capitella teleta]|eukprot:ELT99413.1 hypothetical protein CAPTEDRAFT_219894 [Capitella teleta]